MALGVVLLVSLLSLGWRVGIVVAAAVPLTLAVVFLIMLENWSVLRPHHARRPSSWRLVFSWTTPSSPSR